MNPIFLIIIIAIVVLLFVGWLMMSLNRSTSDSPWKKQLKKSLAKSSPLINSNNANNLKQLVVETDKSLDFAMKNLRVEGDTMGDRLKNANKLFNKALYNKIWEAHKLRNKIAHEFDFNPEVKILKKSYYDLRKGIDVLIKK